MVPVLSLAAPIVFSAVIVFLASAVMHMVLRYHWNDLAKLPREDAVTNALRPLSIPPGDYALPHAGSPEGMKSPDYLDKVTKGPVMYMTVLRARKPRMGGSLVMWFAYSLAVGVFAAYITGRALPPGAAYVEVFRFVGASAFMGYSFALLQNSIWWKRNWTMTAKSMFDGLVYALLTGGTFAWLWPR